MASKLAKHHFAIPWGCISVWQSPFKQCNKNMSKHHYLTLITQKTQEKSLNLFSQRNECVYIKNIYIHALWAQYSLKCEPTAFHNSVFMSITWRETENWKLYKNIYRNTLTKLGQTGPEVRLKDCRWHPASYARWKRLQCE